MCRRSGAVRPVPCASHREKRGFFLRSGDRDTEIMIMVLIAIMKAIARRPKDLQDIEGLLAAHPDADIVAVRHWVREFATAMSMSDMLDDFDKVVARSKSRR